MFWAREPRIIGACWQELVWDPVTLGIVVWSPSDYQGLSERCGTGGLPDSWNQSSVFGRVGGVALAERLSKGVLLDLDALDERGAAKGCAAEETRPVSQPQADPDHREQPTEVRGVPHEGVGTGLDDLMVRLDFNGGREEPSECRHGPPPKGDPRHDEGDADADGPPAAESGVRDRDKTERHHDADHDQDEQPYPATPIRLGPGASGVTGSDAQFGRDPHGEAAIEESLGERDAANERGLHCYPPMGRPGGLTHARWTVIESFPDLQPGADRSLLQEYSLIGE